MWQRFTPSARACIFRAQEEAQRFGDGYVSTEHILLGLVGNPECTAAKALVLLGKDLSMIVRAVEQQLPRGDTKTPDMTLTPKAKRVIDLSYDEARALGDRYIGTKHLLVGLIVERNGLAGQILNKMRIDVDSVRHAVAEMGADPETDESSKVQSIAFTPGQSVSDKSVSWFSEVLSGKGIRELFALMCLSTIDSALNRALTKLTHGHPSNVQMRLFGDMLTQERSVSVSLDHIFEQAEALRVELGLERLRPELIFLVIASDPESTTRKAIESEGIAFDALSDALVEELK